MKYLLSGVALLLAFFSFAQKKPESALSNRKELESQRASLQAQIIAVRQSLTKTRRDKQANLDELALLQRRLALRESSIQNTTIQLRYIHDDINNSDLDIAQIRRDLDTLQARYAADVVFAYKNRPTSELLYFIFSSPDFYAALRRVQYLRAFRADEQERQEEVQRKALQLQNRIGELKKTKAERVRILEDQSKERLVIIAERQEKDAVVFRLRSRERELQKEIADRQRKQLRLASAIAYSIRHSRDLETKKEKLTTSKHQSAMKVDVFVPATSTVSFENLRGRLPWPVPSRTIATPFGLFTYMPGIIGDNKGITIATGAGTAVQAIADGKVQQVYEDLGAVVIRHDKFLTSYINLSDISVTKGQEIKAGQSLGRVDEQGKLDLWLMDDKGQWQDPQKWLRR